MLGMLSFTSIVLICKSLSNLTSILKQDIRSISCSSFWIQICLRRVGGTAADRLCRKSVLCNQQLAEQRVTSLTNPWTTIELYKGSSERGCSGKVGGDGG
jgi:hypothetical protein